MSKESNNSNNIKRTCADLEKALSQFEKLSSEVKDPIKARDADIKKKIKEIQQKIDYLSR